MDSLVEIYLDRADNEIMAAEALKKLSEDINSKMDFGIPEKETFYSSVISHSYYAIFYSAKAVLLVKGIKTSPPEVHKKTYCSFRDNLVKTGFIDLKLLQIYESVFMKADILLDIFKQERHKRGTFTYNTIPQANKEPASNSVANAKVFVSNIRKIVKQA